MAEGAFKSRVGSLAHRRKFERNHSEATVLCAGVSFILGKTYATTKRKLGIPKDLVERSSLSFCCHELPVSATWKYVQVALVQASLPTRTNRLHVNPRDSISDFLQSRFTNNEQKN